MTFNNNRRDQMKSGNSERPKSQMITSRPLAFKFEPHSFNVADCFFEVLFNQAWSIIYDKELE